MLYLEPKFGAIIPKDAVGTIVKPHWGFDANKVKPLPAGTVTYVKESGGPCYEKPDSLPKVSLSDTPRTRQVIHTKSREVVKEVATGHGYAVTVERITTTTTDRHFSDGTSDQVVDVISQSLGTIELDPAHYPPMFGSVQARSKTNRGKTTWTFVKPYFMGKEDIPVALKGLLSLDPVLSGDAYHDTENHRANDKGEWWPCFWHGEALLAYSPDTYVLTLCCLRKDTVELPGYMGKRVVKGRLSKRAGTRLQELFAKVASESASTH